MADSVLELVRLPVNQTPGKGSNGDTILRSTENNFYLPLVFIKKQQAKVMVRHLQWGKFKSIIVTLIIKTLDSTKGGSLARNARETTLNANSTCL